MLQDEWGRGGSSSGWREGYRSAPFGSESSRPAVAAAAAAGQAPGPGALELRVCACLMLPCACTTCAIELGVAVYTCLLLECAYTAYAASCMELCTGLAAAAACKHCKL
jgi:hypothetical protein